MNLLIKDKNKRNRLALTTEQVDLIKKNYTGRIIDSSDTIWLFTRDDHYQNIRFVSKFEAIDVSYSDIPVELIRMSSNGRSRRIV